MIFFDHPQIYPFVGARSLPLFGDPAWAGQSGQRHGVYLLQNFLDIFKFEWEK